jgi:GxxExxY protein
LRKVAGFAHLVNMLVSQDVTAEVIGAAMEVSNILGGGFLEKVYERALVQELHARGTVVEQQVGFPVRFKGVLVGEFVADLVVGGEIVELKCADRIHPDHIAQCLNYLKASGLKVGLTLNFQHTRLEWKRLVL